MAKLDHLGLLVEDSKRAAAWYVDILGLHIEFEIPDAGVTAVRDSSDFTIFLNESNGTHAEATLYFQVDSVDALHGSLADRSVPFVHEPRSNPWGYGAELLDPDGHTVRLWDEQSMKAHPPASGSRS